MPARRTKVQSQSKRLSTLLTITQSLTSELELKDIIHEILEAAIRVIPGADAGILFLYDQDQKKLRVNHAVGLGPDVYEIALEPGEGLSGKAFATRRAQIYRDLRSVRAGMSTANPQNLQLFRRATGGIQYPKSALSAALVYKGEALGALVVENLYAARAFNAFDIKLLDALAQAAATAIVNARLYESERTARIRLQALHEEIRTERDRLERRIAVHGALVEVVREGLPLSALASRLSRICGGSVVILDTLNRVRAAEPAVAAEMGRELPWIDWTRLAAELERAASVRTAQHIESKDQHTLLVSPVTGGGEVLGFLLVHVARTLDAADEAAVDSAALVAAAEFLKERAVQEREIRRLSDFLEELLSGRMPALATPTPAFQPPLLTIVGALHSQDPSIRRVDVPTLRAFVALTQEAIDSVMAGAIVTVRGEHIVAVVPAPRVSEDDLEQALRTSVEKVARLTSRWRPSFAVGGPAERIDLVADAYNEARLAIEVRERFGRHEPVFRVNRLGAFRLILKAVNCTDVVQVCEKVLAPVAEYDRRRQAGLLPTLRAYLNGGFSVKAAATTLHVHPHTVQYRLARVQEITGLNFGFPDDRLTLEIALRVVDAYELL
jgi:GAF domain-containing protein